MNALLKSIALIGVGVLTLDGDPGHLTLIPAAAQAGQLICSSTNYQYSYCRAGVGGSAVEMVDQLSRAPCARGRSWGYDSRGIWVDRGCAARFAYHSAPSASDVAGAAIVGGLIGVLLGSATSDNDARPSYDHRHDSYRRPYPVEIERRRDTSQDIDRSVQKFDRNGNPNYDTEGRYQGPHGTGALVDNPDAPPETNPDGSGGPD